MSKEQSCAVAKGTPTTCKLCLKSVHEVGNLRNSHIIPRFILLKSKENGRTVYFDRDRGRPFLSQTDWKERMLCGACEHRLKVHYEDFINETLFLHRRKPILFEGPERICLSASNDRLALAFISIFWRAVVSTLPEFQYILVPDYIKSELRNWIYSGHIPRNWRTLLSVTIVQLNDKRGNVVYLVTSPFPRDKSAEGHFEFVFIFGGYCVIFGIPSPQNSLSSGRLSLMPQSEIVRIAKIHYEAIPELKKLISKMVEASGGEGVGKNSRS
jgi:hypothetical protein